MYPVNKVFMECLDKIVVILILVTYLSTRRRKKNHWAGEETFEDRHAKEEELYQPPSPRNKRPRWRPGVSASHFSQWDQAFPCQGNQHQGSSAPSEITSIWRVDGYQLELPPELPIVHNVFHASHSGNVSNFLTSPVSTRTSTTSHRPPAQYDLCERSQLQSGSSRTTNTKPCHRVLQGSMEHQTEAEAVWGREDYPKSKFPYSFPRLVWESRGRDSCKGGRSVTPWFSCHNT